MEYRGFGAPMQHNQVYRAPSASSSSFYTNFSDHALEGAFWSRRTVGGGVGESEVLRELEKKRIREEILAAEPERMRVLDAEVRRRYLMEREMKGMQSGGGFPSSSSLMLGHPDNCYDRFQPQIMHRQPYAPMDRRSPMPFLEGYVGCRRQTDEDLGLEVVPPRPKAKEIITLTPKVGENGVVGLAKPYLGVKRKQPPPTSSPAAGGSTEISSGSKKKTNEWSCALCLVSATSERGLQDHLGGKKHKAKAADLKADLAGKSEKSVTKNSPESVQMDSNEDKKAEGECSGQKFKFWCRMCKVGASDKKEFNMHKKGVTHLTNQLDRAQKSRRKAGGS